MATMMRVAFVCFGLVMLSIVISVVAVMTGDFPVWLVALNFWVGLISICGAIVAIVAMLWMFAGNFNVR